MFQALLLSLYAVVVLTGGSPLDLSASTILIPSSAPLLLETYAGVLATQVFAKSGLRWPITRGTANTTMSARTTISITTASDKEVDYGSPRAEGYTIQTKGSTVNIAGTDSRGALYGIGRLLRSMNLSLTENYYDPRVGHATLPLSVLTDVASSPRRPMRGLQIGYRPKTNSYDGLTVDTFNELITDLALFGANMIELIPKAFDDAPYSPHYSLSHFDMNIAMSKACDRLGLNVSLWYPACDPSVPRSAGNGCVQGDYTNATVMNAALADWDAHFAAIPRIDTLFINAGDPGGQSPDHLVMIAQAARPVLKKYHPNANLWICPQDWEPKDYARWVELASLPNAKTWLDGIVYAPGMIVNLPTFRDATLPNRFPIRLYPDITHSVADQLPVPNWDPMLSTTNYREAINPRPTQHAFIASSQIEYANAGASTYNEGAHDDVNKHVWLALLWGSDDGDVDPQTLAKTWLTEYCRFHFGPNLAPLVVEGIYALEQNWILQDEAGAAQIARTLSIFRSIEVVMTPRDRWKWRLQQLMYRANFDAHALARATAQRIGEASALRILRAAVKVATSSATTNFTASLDAASAALDAADTRADHDAAELYTELRVWAEALFQSIHQQFSVPIYGSEYTRRGATLDSARFAQSDAPHLRVAIAAARKEAAKDGPAAAKKDLATVVNWEVVAEGDFYDDIGGTRKQAPHYVINNGVNGSQPQCGDQAIYQSNIVTVASPEDQYYDCSTGKSGAPPRLSNATRRSQLTAVKSAPLLPSSWALVRAVRSGVEEEKYDSTGVHPVAPQTPIELRYPGLAKDATWTVRATGIGSKARFNVTANGALACTESKSRHDDDDDDDVEKTKGVYSCVIPPALTATGGDLSIHFESNCCEIELAEVWLLRGSRARLARL